MTAPNQSEPATPPTPQQHASWLHQIFTALDELVHIASSPEVLALLPPKYQGYALAVSAVEHAVVNASIETSSAPTVSTPAAEVAPRNVRVL